MPKITTSKTIDKIRDKLSNELTTTEIIFLRKFCKKHGYFALYKALNFDRLSLTKQ